MLFRSHLINPKKLTRYSKFTQLDFWTAVIAMVGVLTLGILQGLLLADLIGLLALLIGTKTRSTSILGKVPGEKIYLGLENYPEGETYPGLLILRFDGSLYFANAPDAANELRAAIEMSDPSPKVVLIDGESINSIDATAIIQLEEVVDELKRSGIGLKFARIRSNVMEIVERTGFIETVGSHNFYISNQDAVDAFLVEQEQQEIIS